MLPTQILMWITVFGKERPKNVLSSSQRHVKKNSLTWSYALKTSWRYLYKKSWRFVEDVLKTFWRHLEDDLKTSSRRLLNVLKRFLQDVLKTWPRRIYWSWPRHLEDDLKTSFEDVRLRRTYSSFLSRRLQDVSWR